MVAVAYSPQVIELFDTANWLEIGQTQGRGRHDRAHRRQSSVKRIFVYPLQTQARERLREGTVAAPVAVAKQEPQDWAEIDSSGASETRQGLPGLSVNGRGSGSDAPRGTTCE